jgi:uncharacterized protein YjbJ (UPF0337 family)
MSAGEKFRNSSEAFTGKMKRRLGEATDDPRLTAEGRSMQRRGNLRQAVQKVKDAFKR